MSSVGSRKKEEALSDFLTTERVEQRPALPSENTAQAPATDDIAGTTTERTER